MRLRSAIFALTGILAVGGTALASSEASEASQAVALTPADIAQVMSDAGYAMTEFEIEDGEIEAEGKRAGASWEVVIDGKTGEILSAEQDD